MADSFDQGNFWSVTTQPRTFYRGFGIPFGTNPDSTRTAVFSFFGWEGAKVPGGVAIGLAPRGPLFVFDPVPVGADIAQMLELATTFGRQDEIDHVLVGPLEAVHLAITGYLKEEDLAGSLEESNTIITTATFRRKSWKVIISPAATSPYSARNVKGALVLH